MSIVTSKTPKFPEWIEQECKTKANDVYDFEQNPKLKPQNEPIKLVEYVIYGILLLISILIATGFVDLLSLAKGKDLGLLKAIFSWW